MNDVVAANQLDRSRQLSTICSLIGPVAASIVLAMYGSGWGCLAADEAALKLPADDELKVLIDQLVSPNSEPAVRIPSIKYPKNYDKAAQKVVRAAYRKLKLNAPQSFPYVMELLDDKRYALSEDAGDYMQNYSVGELCEDVIVSNLQPDVWDHKEFGTSFRRRPHQPDYVAHFGLRTPKRAKEWWQSRQNQSLVELQIEVLEWIVSEAEKMPDTYPKDEIANVRKELGQLKETRSPRPAPSMFAR